MAKKLPRMGTFRPPPALVEESLLSFDEMRRQMGGVTERRLLAVVGEDTPINAKMGKDVSEKESSSEENDS